MVKNECDIVESFVRFHCQFIDKMLILDNGSSDTTTKILQLLKHELPIEVLFDPTPLYCQDEVMTKLARMAFDDLGADLVIPIDCDEFIFGKNIVERIQLEKMARMSDTLYYIPWITYVPSENDIVTERNPIKRLSHRRMKEGVAVYKVALPKGTFNAGAKLTQGSHDIVDSEARSCKKMILDDLKLGHYPIRSSKQAISKYVVGWLANLARNNGVLFDWLPYYKLTKKQIANGLSISTIKSMAMRYANSTYEELDGIVLDSITNYSDVHFELRYGALDTIDPIKNLVDYAEQLAKSHGNYFSGQGELNLVNANILKKICSYMEIDGWLSPLEAINLYQTVSDYPNDNIRVVEIGSWQGKSSYVLAKAILDSKKQGVLYCIDPFNGDGDEYSKPIYHSSPHFESLAEKFNENMLKFGVSQVVRAINKYSSDALEDIKGEIDVLFIDGSHEYESVLNDFINWAPKLRVGGYLLVHDVGSESQPGPRRMVTEQLIDQLGWSKYKLFDELFICQKLTD